MPLRLSFLRFAAFRIEMLAMFLILVPLGFAQSELATVFGRVTDQSGAVVSQAAVEIRNVETNAVASTTTNSDGLYSVPALHPGHYVIFVSKPGFRTVSATGMELNVQDNVVRNFLLQVGSAAESITVTAEAAKINTSDATVSTIVDRNFAENLPMNGRSFQTLIQLTPGVVLVPSTAQDAGQFSVNGQRANANYWMVDGVSANIGVSSTGTLGNGLSGSLGSFGVLGGTNGLISLDAMQEFRIQTSTFAPEFGRTPGAQISIASRAGSNQFHGTAFDYFRNDILDANDWFADRAGLPKPQERQNDFGGTLSGPLVKDRTFFFFSYEGLRLRLPQTTLSTVPTLAARQAATSSIEPFLNAYPLPNGPDLGDGSAEFNASYSNRSSIDAYALRIDHTLNRRLNVFGRYDYSPSNLVQRGGLGFASLNTLFPTKITTRTATVGSTWSISPDLLNDIRVNYSTTDSMGRQFLDGFGGALPVDPPFPSSFNQANAEFVFEIFSLSNFALETGALSHTTQRQFNIVDSLTFQHGSHSLKMGVDFRRLAPEIRSANYAQAGIFLDVNHAENGSLLESLTESSRSATLLFRNLGVFAQDTWRVLPRLTLTYGLRWDLDFVPSTTNGPNLLAVTGFDPLNFSHLALAPNGTPPYHTSYGNVAPRLGVAYQLSQNQKWQTVIRGGAGIFYDLATQEVGNNISAGFYPFGAIRFNVGGTFPLDSATAAPPPITADSLSGFGTLFALDPHLVLPYTIEWNFSAQQSLGNEQTITASYLGASGKKLIQTESVTQPNENFGFADLISNSARSNYNALQIQFQRQLSHGLQVLSGYTWSHSLDDASAGSWGNGSNLLVPGTGHRINWGSSDFDIRHQFSAAVTYALPSHRNRGLVSLALEGWSVQNTFQVRSASPVDLHDSDFSSPFVAEGPVRPDVVPGQSFYLFGAFPGGKALNPDAFTDPPIDPNSGNPLRQGDLRRNTLRGFGAWQWDFGVHREFHVFERVRLQFRAEMFNLLNHPNFGPPVNDLSNTSQFGMSTKMLGRSLNENNLGAGGFSPLYQIGGPRSIQLALKLVL
jgi:hypothetical protein